MSRLHKSHRPIARGDGELVAEVLACGQREAQRHWMLPMTFRRCVQKVEREPAGYVRSAYRILRREVVLRMRGVPRLVRGQALEALPDASREDPWDVDADGLPGETAVVAECPCCYGKKKIDCASCDGQGRLGCGECGGGGRVQGQRGMKNCPACRGKGDVRCPDCSRGRVPCAPCDAKGRVNAWLEVVEKEYVEVRLWPEDGPAVLHANREAPENLDLEPSQYVHPLVDDSGWQTSLAERLPKELASRADPRRDRIQQFRVQRFKPDLFRVDYGVGAKQGALFVAGSPPALLPYSDWTPIRQRRNALLMLAAGVGVGALLVSVRYASRGPWFASQPAANYMPLLAGLAAIFSLVAAAAYLMPPAIRKANYSRALGVGAGALWLAVAVTWFVASPSIASVRSALDQGELMAARGELEAFAVAGIHGPEAQELRSRLDVLTKEHRSKKLAQKERERLSQIEGASNAVASSALYRAHGPWIDSERQEAALQALSRQAELDLAAATEGRDTEALSSLIVGLEGLDDEVATAAEQRLTVLRSEACLQQEDWRCAAAPFNSAWRSSGDEGARELLQNLGPRLAAQLQEAAKDPERLAAMRDRRDAEGQRAALAEQDELLRLTEVVTQDDLQVERARLQRSLAGVQRRIEAAEAAEARKAAAAERRRVARERAKQRREERRQAAERRRANRVQCCDGTLSPSCSYDRSLRGCCSHHGGVC